MKTFLYTFSIPFLLLTSCAPIYNYQVFKTESEDLTLKDDELIYEDSNCIVSYNLWSEYGNPSFTFYNKTDNLIIIDLADCFFTSNGIANDYFKNRTYTYTSGSSNSVSNGITNTASVSYTKSSANSIAKPTYLPGIKSNTQSNSITGSSSNERTLNNTASNSREYSVTIQEERMIKIPAKAAKVLSEFQIVDTRFRHCDLLKDPVDKSGIDSIYFNKDNSPFVFSNSLVYKLESNPEYKYTVNNTFYVNSILNLKEDVFFYYDYLTGCNGQKSEFKEPMYKYYSPFNFFLQYSTE
jgi:hypothetical protein